MRIDISRILICEACIAQGADYLHSGCMCRYREEEGKIPWPALRCMRLVLRSSVRGGIYRRLNHSNASYYLQPAYRSAWTPFLVVYHRPS